MYTCSIQPIATRLQYSKLALPRFNRIEYVDSISLAHNIEPLSKLPYTSQLSQLEYTAVMLE